MQLNWWFPSSYFKVYNNEVKKKCKCLNLASMFNEPYNFIHVNGVNSLCVAYMNCSNTEAWLSDCGGGGNIYKFTVSRFGDTSTNQMAVGGVGDHKKSPPRNI